jgi:hypothetical protein
VDRPVLMAGKRAAGRRQRTSSVRSSTARKPAAAKDLSSVKSDTSCSAPAQARSHVQSWETIGAPTQQLRRCN